MATDSRAEQQFVHSMANGLATAMLLTEVSLKNLQIGSVVTPEDIARLQKASKALSELRTQLMARRKILIDQEPADK